MNCSRLLHAAVVSATCALVTAPAALAATTTTPTGENTPLSLEPAPAAEQTSSGGGIVRTIVGLAIVLGVIYGLHWVLKQVKAGRESQSTGRGLQPLSTLALGPGRSLHLVRAGGEVVLVGSAEHGVTPLRTWSMEEAVALGLLSEDGDDDGGDEDRRSGTPLNAGPGSPPDLRRLVRRAQTWTVRK